jgi:hypothetical protein
MQTEQEIETAIITWLNEQPDTLAFKFPRGQKSHTRRNTVRHSGNGVADIILNKRICDILFTAYIEVKKPGGKLRKSQIEFMERLQNLGGTYVVVRSVFEVKEFLIQFDQIARTRILASHMKLVEHD